MKRHMKWIFTAILIGALLLFSSCQEPVGIHLQETAPNEAQGSKEMPASEETPGTDMFSELITRYEEQQKQYLDDSAQKAVVISEASEYFSYEMVSFPSGLPQGDFTDHCIVEDKGYFAITHIPDGWQYGDHVWVCAYDYSTNESEILYDLPTGCWLTELYVLGDECFWTVQECGDKNEFRLERMNLITREITSFYTVPLDDLWSDIILDGGCGYLTWYIPIQGNEQFYNAYYYKPGMPAPQEIPGKWGLQNPYTRLFVNDDLCTLLLPQEGRVVLQTFDISAQSFEESCETGYYQVIFPEVNTDYLAWQDDYSLGWVHAINRATKEEIVIKNGFFNTLSSKKLFQHWIIICDRIHFFAYDLETGFVETIFKIEDAEHEFVGGMRVLPNGNIIANYCKDAGGDCMIIIKPSDMQ